jgi:hypothetical protein
MAEEDRDLPPGLIRLDAPLRLDREGRWWHDGEPVTHAGIHDALHRWLDRDDSTGRFVVRAGREWCFVEVDDVPAFVRRVRAEGDGVERRVLLVLADGAEEELDPATLRQAADNVLYCTVRAGRMPARFDRSAYWRLAQWVEFDGATAVLPAAGRRWPIEPLPPRPA